MALTIFDEREPYLRVNKLDDSNTPGGGGLVDAASPMLRVDEIWVSTDNTSDIHVTLKFDDTFGDVANVVTVVVPANAGTVDGIPPVDLLLASGLKERGIIVKSNCGISFYVAEALVTGKLAWCVTHGGYL